MHLDVSSARHTGQLIGCRSCGHTQTDPQGRAAGQEAGTCPRCGATLRALGPLGTRLLREGTRRPDTGT
jgi:uncharacterized paraquat-inducible protein A